MWARAYVGFRWREAELRRKCSLTPCLIFSINSGGEGLKANNKSVGESVLEIMEDNHFSSRQWEEEREGWWEERQREDHCQWLLPGVCVIERDRVERGVMAQLLPPAGWGEGNSGEHMSIWCERQHEHFILWRTDRMVGLSFQPVCVWRRGF